MIGPAAPRVGFLIGGVQKAGTTALARSLSAHPSVLLPVGKEAHVFDAPEFDDAWSVSDIDARYAPLFEPGRLAQFTGDATPIYCLHERFVQRIARYNPAMRWVISLRHPVERAISQYYMERKRGDETLPLALALLAEPWRLRGHRDDFSAGSPLRRHSYCLRGAYSQQLDTLLKYFARDQVLVLRSSDFRNSPREVLGKIYAHLGLPGPILISRSPEVFAGDYTPPSRFSPAWALASWRLRGELRRLRDRHGIDFA